MSFVLSDSVISLVLSFELALAIFISGTSLDVMLSDVILFGVALATFKFGTSMDVIYCLTSCGVICLVGLRHLVLFVLAPATFKSATSMDVILSDAMWCYLSCQLASSCIV